nr:hypothetical protein [Armatimonas sp.]
MADEVVPPVVAAKKPARTHTTFPYYEKENATLRSEFGLPKTRPFRPTQE